MLGVTDEAAHSATAVLLTGVLPGRTDVSRAGAVLGAVIIDLDHLPGELGRAYLKPGAGHPGSHALVSAAVVAAVAMRFTDRRRTFLRGAALGVLTHPRDGEEPDEPAARSGGATRR